MATIINEQLLHDSQILMVDVDPSIGSGTPANPESIALDSSGAFYRKIGIANTDWVMFVPQTGSGGSAGNPVPQSQAVTAASNFTSRSTLALQFSYITYSPELNLFVAVSNNGTNKIVISKDAINWREVLSPVAAGHLTVTWSPKLRKFLILTYFGLALTSPDGINWTTQAINDAYWFGACWSPKLNLFCAVSLSGSTGFATSPDGIAWTDQTGPFSTNVNDVCWSPQREIFCAVRLGGSSTCAATSADGVTWTARALPNQQWYAVTWAKELGLFCAVSITGTNRCATSPDGITWTLRAIPVKVWRSVTWSAELGMLIAFGDSNSMAYSFDGLTWTLGSTGIAGTNLWFDCVWSKEAGYFVVIGSTGTARIITSTFTQNFANTFEPSAVNLTVNRTASFTLSMLNAFNTTLVNAAAPVTVTVPSDTTDPSINIGEKMQIVQSGAGTVNFSPAVGVTIVSKSGLLGSAIQYQVMQIEKIGSNLWLLSFSA